MKKVYWRPRAVSRTALLLISMLSIAGWLLVEFNFHRSAVQQKEHGLKLRAAKLATRCMQAIRKERERRGHPIDLNLDPADTGLIGVATSAATSTAGIRAAKQTSINPNFAAVIVDMLRQAGVQKGDVVAVGYSGSFPAINICVDAAMETMRVKPVCISSAAGSQWGANIPDFLWLDMEKTLYDQKLISFRSVRASIGGIEDRGLGMDTKTLSTLQDGIVRSGLPPLEPVDTFKESVDQRMEVYKEGAAGERVQVFVNVGGGTTSVGRKLGKRLLRPGLNTTIPHRARDIDSVMTRFLSEGVPVIHMIRIRDLARRYNLEIEPLNMPDEGLGAAFVRQEYNVWLILGTLALILGSLYAFVRSDWGFRVFQSAGRRKASGHPEPMV